MSRNEKIKLGAVHWWTVPIFFVVLGLICVAVAAVGGHLTLGLLILGVTIVFGLALLVLGRRSETYREATEHPDERSAAISGGAWAGTGIVLLIGNLGAFIGSLAAGHDGSPFYWLLGVGVLAYVVFTAFLRRVS